MITGGTPFIVSAYVFGYAVLVGYSLSLRARGRRLPPPAPTSGPSPHATPRAKDAP